MTPYLMHYRHKVPAFTYIPVMPLHTGRRYAFFRSRPIHRSSQLPSDMRLCDPEVAILATSSPDTSASAGVRSHTKLGRPAPTTPDDASQPTAAPEAAAEGCDQDNTPPSSQPPVTSSVPSLIPGQGAGGSPFSCARDASLPVPGPLGSAMDGVGQSSQVGCQAVPDAGTGAGPLGEARESPFVLAGAIHEDEDEGGAAPAAAGPLSGASPASAATASPVAPSLRASRSTAPATPSGGATQLARQLPATGSTPRTSSTSGWSLQSHAMQHSKAGTGTSSFGLSSLATAPSSHLSHSSSSTSAATQSSSSPFALLAKLRHRDSHLGTNRAVASPNPAAGTSIPTTPANTSTADLRGSLLAASLSVQHKSRRAAVVLTKRVSGALNTLGTTVGNLNVVSPAHLSVVDRSLPLHSQLGLVCLIGVFVLYPSWVQAALGVFSCYVIDTGAEPYPAHQRATWRYGYWVSDMAQQCYEGRHLRVHVPIGVVAIGVFCLAPPVASLLLLTAVRRRRRRRQLGRKGQLQLEGKGQGNGQDQQGQQPLEVPDPLQHDEYVRQVYGFLYDRYR